MDNRVLILYPCPTCGVGMDEPCVTPKGRRKKKNVHDTRPSGIGFKEKGD
jgi:hypothetical protein